MNSLKQKDSIKKKKQKQQKEHVLLYKLLYSFMTMLVYMVGRNIPLYGIDIDAYSNVNVDAQSILLQAISGDMKNCSIFIIGLWPYMLASMLAILIVAIMSLDHTRKLSPKKINIWTVTIMMIIAAVQAYHKTQTLMYRVSGYELIWNKIIVFIQLIAGMLIVVYMCDRATKYGIGGKVSVFMVNIVSGMMTMFTGKPLEKLALPVAIGVAEIEVYESDESELTANRPARKLMDLVILDRDITLSEEKAFTKFTRGYCLFATENVQMLNSATSRYFKARMGQYLYTGDVQYFLAHEVRNYYPNPYGEKFNPAKLAVSDSFTGRVACDGNYNLVLDGEFGENFSQIAYWRYNIPVFEGQCIDMYLEYEKTGDVEIKLRLFQFYYGSIGDIKQVWEFDEEQLQDVFRIDNESDQGPVFVSILARGTGSLNIISLHDRHSRRGHGFFLPGGERLVSSKGEEVFVYFEKGDMKPPLAVYFSGYRTQEGFEGYYMMRGFGCPFILVTDPRSEGGAFYLGDSEFEQMITDYVTDKLDELGLTKDELVLSGASMGTFGSLYYGSKLSPHALLLAKPLANMGNVARNERILRAGGFATSLDILMKNYDNLSDEAIEQLNNRMWDRFDSADWSQTKFIISYLYEDDYDPDGYPSILSHLKSSGVEVYGKGSHGRHTDNSANVMAWFKSQYNNLLHDDFSR